MENETEFLVTSFKVHFVSTPGRQKSLSHLIEETVYVIDIFSFIYFLVYNQNLWW